MKNIYTYFYISILQLLLAGIAVNSQAQCPTIANATYSSTDVTCAGANDGTVTVELGDGTAPFNYFLFDLNQNQFLLTATRTVGPANKVVFSNLHASDYIVQVRKPGCANINIGGLGITVNEPAPLELEITTQTNISGCFGEATGSFSVRARGGNGSYQYSFNGGAFGTTTTYNNLTAGTYTVQVKDAKDCTKEITVEITQPTQLTAAISSQVNPGCNSGTTGSIVVSGSGGTPGYTYSINGGDFGTASTFSNLTAGNYTIRVKDNKDCEVTLPTVTLTEPPVLTVGLAGKTDITGCFGDSTGEISVNTSGGTPGYSYSINNGTFSSGTGTFSNLTAGTYNIVVRDANGCTATLAPVTISQPTQVAISLVSKKDIDGCNGDATGEIVVSASGGTAGYEYSINGGAFSTSASFSSLTAGDYSIQVRDSKGCIATLPTLTITQPAALTANVATQTNPSCFGSTDGSIIINTSGGTPDYQYSVNGRAFTAGTGTFSNLGAGDYNIIVRDSKNCQITLPTVTLTQPTLLSIALTSETDVTSCFGDATGEIVTAVSGGTSPYSYSVNGGAFASGTGSFNNLTAATYNIVVQDANGCRATLAPVAISQPTQLTISLTSKKDIDTCFGDATGEIGVAVNGGTPGYEYSVNGGAFAAGTGTFSNLPAGTYTITVRDSKGCQTPLAPVEITQPAQLTAAVSSQTNISCNGSSTGSIGTSASGGTAGYQYSINGGQFGTSSSFNNLAAGDYTIQVRDSKGCLVTLPTVTLTQPTLLTIALTSKTDITSCFGDATGEIVTAVSGGTSGYEYSVNGAAFVSGTGTFSNLTAGTYNIVVRDANGCTATLAPVTISQPTQVAISLVSKKDIDGCNGDATGEIVVSASGGTAGYEYSINGGAFSTSASFSSLTAGDYSIQVRDSKGCIATLPTLTITQPTAISVSLVAKSDVSCNGGSDGSVTVSASGGAPGYTYSVNGGAFTSNATFSGLKAGNYNIEAKDAKGCIATLATVVITEPAQLSIALVSKTDPGCNGSNTGSITVAVSGGTTDYQYSINGGSFASTATFNNLTAGTYTIIARDSKGCTVELAPQTLTNPSLVSVSVTSQVNPSCNGGNDGRITVSGSGGTSPYEYAINGGSFTSNNVFTSLAAGTYTISVKDANNCTATLSGIVLSQPDAISAVVSNTKQVSCNGGADGSITLSVSGGISPYTYSLNGGLFTSLTEPISGLTSNTYSITVKDAQGCTAALPVITISQPAALTLAVTSQTDINVCAGVTSGSVSVAASGGTPAYLFALDGGAFDTNATFNNLTAGNHTIQVKDANNCTTQVSVTITATTGALTASAKKTDPSCHNGSNGFITVENVAGGTGVYAYSLDGNSFQDSPTFSGLIAGDYTITVRDKNTTSCTATVQVTLSNPPALSATATSVSPSACGVNDGSITVTATGGTSTYTYSINGGSFSNNNVFNNLVAGSYGIVVMDASSCTFTLPTIILTAPSTIGVSLSAKKDVTCNGESNGNISVTASGGTSPYNYSIDGVNFTSNNIFENLAAGTYDKITVRDAKGCRATLVPVTISEPAVLSLSVVATQQVSCYGETDGSIIVSATGGTGAYSYSVDGTTFISSATLSNLAAGTYDVVVKDEKGCMAIVADVEITEPAALTATVSAVNPTSCTATDGSLTVSSVSGGSSPYSYSLDGVSYQSTQSFTGLAAGAYVVYIKDAKGCEINLPQTLTAPAGVTATVAVTDETACEAKDGSITVTATGATGSYSYYINGEANPAGITNHVFSGLLPASYSIRVVDANGCEYSLSNVVVATNCTNTCTLAATAAVSNVRCATESNGSITVTATAGTAPYSYSIDGTNFVTTATFSGLRAGEYTIRVRDAKDCEVTVIATVTEPAALTAAVSAVNPTSCTATDGSLTVSSVSGGSSPYSYSLDGVNFSTSNVFSGLSDGSYTIYIRDTNNCLLTQSQTLTSPGGLTARITPLAESECGANNGMILVSSVRGSSGPYSYLIDLDGNGIFVDNPSGSGNNLFIGLKGKQSYQVRVVAPNGCSYTSAAVTIPSPCAPVCSLTASVQNTEDVSCNGGVGGSVTVQVTGGTGSYEYSIDGINYQGVATFDGLSAGSYTISIRDKADNTCSTTVTATISQPDAMSATITSTNPSGCTNSDGSITIESVNGGTSPYSYSLNNTTYQSASGFTGLSNGTYTIYIKDAEGCISTQSATLTSTPGIVASASAQGVTCKGAKDGNITIGSVNGGSGNYQYSLDGATFQNETTFVGLSGGNYTVTVKDITTACLTTVSVAIAEPDVLGIALVSKADVLTCYGGATGEIVITASGGTSPYSYSVNGGAFAAGTGTFSDLKAGEYSIEVRDAKGCRATLVPVTISEPAVLSLSVVATQQVSCYGETDGSIIVSATGGTGAYSYSVDGTTFISSATLSNLAAGTYDVVVKDEKGCMAIVADVEITEPAALTATVSAVNPTSCTATDGSLTVSSVSGGSSPYSYSLDGVNFSTSNVFSGLSDGAYTIYIKDNKGCQINLTETLEAASEINAVNISATAETSCGANDGTITVGTVTGAAGPYQYFIDGVLNPAGADNNIFAGLAPKSYIITVVAANGCKFSTSATVGSPCTPTCTLTARIISSPVLCDGQSDGTAELIEVTGGSGNYEYSIDGISFQNVPSFDNLAAGTYTISVRDKKNTSCTASFTTNVTSQFRVSGIIVVTEPKTCNDKGSIEFTNISGGTAAYSFSVDGSTFSSTMLYSGLDAGIYPATIQDANNCIFRVNITIKGVSPITATVTQSAPVSCNGESDGKIKIDNVRGGSGTYVYSLDGSNFSGTQEFTGLKGGDYTVYIKDQSGSCINTFKITVAEPAKVVADLTLKQPSKCSVNDGEIIVNVTSGGVAPFTYKLNDGSFQPENRFTALAGGDYTIIVKSANGCTAKFTTTLKVPNGIVAKAEAISAVSCSGKEDGSARIFDVTGGSGMYEYSKDGITYQTSALFTNLAAGTYILYVRDKGLTDGCTASYPVIVTEATQIIADITKKDPATCTSKDGEIIIGTVNGGTAPYLYSLDGITYQNSNTFSGLDNGSYAVYVKDSKGCFIRVERTLASPNAVTVGTPTIIQPTCKGGNDGELTMNNVGNGIEPYQYSIDGVTYQASAKFTSLKAGKYTVRVKDATGCIYSFNYEIAQPEGINYQISNLAASACGEPTGSVEITNISGGIAPYLFSIDGTNFQSNPVFDKLTAGQYNLFIRDNTPSGCVVKDVFTVQGVTAITYKIDSVSIGCEGGNKGRIVVSELKGGNKPYQVSINNGNTWQFVQDDNIAYTDLAPGSYQLIIKYGANCQTAVRNITIHSGGLPIEVATTAATCGTANGSATAIMPDASKKYFYSIDNNRFQESPVFLDLKAGKYTMYVRESADDVCPKQTTFAVAGPDSLKYDLQKVDCFDVRVLNIRGGTSPYRVSLDGGKTFVSGYIFPQSPNYLATNLAPGEYSIVVADNAGCSTIPVPVRIDNKITAKVTATLSLPDEPTGEIRVTDIRGGNAPYEVSTDGLNWAVVKDKTLPIDTVITAQHMGRYVVYIRDANGCVKQYETEIKESKFTIPNIFTPNGDGVNDTFFIRNLPAGTFVTIANRWGKIVFKSDNYQNDWNGEGYAEGIYFYTVNIAAQGRFTGWVEIKR